MIINLITDKLPSETYENTLVIQMFTASWCPPCQKTKEVLFGHNLKTDNFKNFVLKILCDQDYEKHAVYTKFVSVLEYKKELMQGLYLLGLGTLEKIKTKKTGNMDLSLVNLGQIIIKQNGDKKNLAITDDIKSHLTDKNVQRILYLGFVSQLFTLQWLIFLTDVDKYPKESRKIQSIPTFQLSVFFMGTKKTYVHYGAITNEAILGQILANLFFQFQSEEIK